MSVAVNRVAPLRAELDRQADQEIIDTFGPLIAAPAEEEARRSEEEALLRYWARLPPYRCAVCGKC
jgi:hypothetical protein